MAVEFLNSLQLEGELDERVRRIASARHVSSQEIVRAAVKDYIERAEQREEFQQTAVASFEHYRATGLHVTGEEMEEWMLKIEAGEDLPPPECHV